MPWKPATIGDGAVVEGGAVRPGGTAMIRALP